jgi:hypothetical protein
MQANDERHALIQQLTTIGERVQAVARAMGAGSRIDSQHLDDLQALAAQLTDTANELAQYVDLAGGQSR